MLNRSQNNRILLVSAAIGLIYLLISAGWILFSDYLAAIVASTREELETIQQYKGLAFIGMMSLLVTWLVYRIQRHGVILERTLHHAHTDIVTGLSNRLVAEEYLEKSLEDVNRGISNCGVILVNIRGLSRINRYVGRSGGDYLLFKVGQRIQKFLRSGDLVARLEGNRFLIILDSLADNREGINIGNRILQAFETPVIINKVEVQADVQCVFAMAPRDGRTRLELLDASERALYRVKKGSEESSLVLISGEDQHDDTVNLQLESELRKAIKEHRLSIVLQPQVRLDTLEVAGAEALVRWNSEKLGNVPPAEFIPLAESLGLVQEITRQVLDASGACLSDWLTKDRPHIHISVNLSSLDLRSGHIVETVKSFLDRHHIPGNLIVFEITETWLMEDPTIALGLIYKLRDLGTQFAIDDFGTGYSALSQLIDFPFDCVKFDRSFVSGINHSQKKVKILTAIQRLSSTLGAQTIAEGVETMDELALLEEIGIDGAQGFLFAKPVSPEEFVAKYLDPEKQPFTDIQEKLEKIREKNPKRAVRIGKAG